MQPSDDILRRFFELERWQKAMDTAVDKGISRALLRQMAEPQTRIALYRAIAAQNYNIDPPRAVRIPKDTRGNYRTVYVNAPADRVILSIANDLLFQLTPERVHPSCKSYLTGIGPGRVVIEASQRIAAMQSLGEVVGWKGDLSKYFDSVPITFVDQAFAMVEQEHGHSALIDMLRRYYHCDEYVDTNGNIAHKFMSLRQGCAVSAWLSDVLLYHIDQQLSQLNGYYVRYSDDMLFVGPDHENAREVLDSELGNMQLRLNPDKVEPLRSDRWFCFLGFAVKGKQISLSQRRLKKFSQMIDLATHRAKDMAHAVRRVNRVLYRGHDRFSWATQVLPVINCRHDIDVLNAYVMDAIRAAHTGHHRIGGLGFDAAGADGCIVRMKGRNVAANRKAAPSDIPGYLSLGCMRKALKTSRAAYDTLVRQM